MIYIINFSSLPIPLMSVPRGGVVVVVVLLFYVHGKHLRSLSGWSVNLYHTFPGQA